MQSQQANQNPVQQTVPLKRCCVLNQSMPVCASLGSKQMPEIAHHCRGSACEWNQQKQNIKQSMRDFFEQTLPCHWGQWPHCTAMRQSPENTKKRQAKLFNFLNFSVFESIYKSYFSRSPLKNFSFEFCPHSLDGMWMNILLFSFCQCCACDGLLEDFHFVLDNFLCSDFHPCDLMKIFVRSSCSKFHSFVWHSLALPRDFCRFSWSYRKLADGIALNLVFYYRWWVDR